MIRHSLNSGKILKKTWQLINEAINNNPASNKIEKICENGKTLTEDQDKANAFNRFFNMAGKHVRSSVHPTSTSHNDLLPPTVAPEIDMYDTSPSEIGRAHV